jgi:hypothetical protein
VFRGYCSGMLVFFIHIIYELFSFTDFHIRMLVHCTSMAFVIFQVALIYIKISSTVSVKLDVLQLT